MVVLRSNFSFIALIFQFDRMVVHGLLAVQAKNLEWLAVLDAHFREKGAVLSWECDELQEKGTQLRILQKKKQAR